MSFSKDLAQKLANHSIGVQAYPLPTTVYIALFSADPGETSSLANELSGSGYQRINVYGKLDATSGVITNTELVNSEEATANWQTITHLALVDASTAGKIMYQGALTTPKDVPAGERFSMLPADMQITLS